MAPRAALLLVTAAAAQPLGGQQQQPWHNREGGPLQHDALAALLPAPSPPSVTSVSSSSAPDGQLGDVLARAGAGAASFN